MKKSKLKTPSLTIYEVCYDGTKYLYVNTHHIGEIAFLPKITSYSNHSKLRMETCDCDKNKN